MGGFKRHLEELEELYGPRWSWSGDWNNPDFYPDPEKGQDGDGVDIDHSDKADPDQDYCDVQSND